MYCVLSLHLRAACSQSKIPKIVEPLPDIAAYTATDSSNSSFIL